MIRSVVSSSLGHSRSNVSLLHCRRCRTGQILPILTISNQRSFFSFGSNSDNDNGNSNDDKSNKDEKKAENNKEEKGDESKSTKNTTSPLTPTRFGFGDEAPRYPHVLALPVISRPLFPGVITNVTLTDPVSRR